MIVIKKAINARREAASQRHKEIQTTAVLALLVLAKTLPVLEGGALHVARSFAGSRPIFQEKHQVGGLASPSGSKTSPSSALVGSVLPAPSHQNVAGKCQLGRRSRRTNSSSPLPGPGDPVQRRELPKHLSAPAALSAWSSRKKERDDVSVAEPTSNALNLAAVRTWSRGQAQRWMQNAFKCRSKLDLNLILRAGGDLTRPLLCTAGGETSRRWRQPLEPGTAAPALLLPKSMSEGLRASPTQPSPCGEKRNWGERLGKPAAGQLSGDTAGDTHDPFCTRSCPWVSVWFLYSHLPI